jgi:hypothetical protein
MDSNGPIYCETLHANLGLIEPVNAVTSVVPVIVAVGLVWYLRRRGRGAVPEYVLLALLALTGIGSFFWHGFRTEAALTADVIPGLALYAGLIFVWLWRSLHRTRALLLFGLFVAAHAGIVATAAVSGVSAAVATAIATIAVFAFILVTVTYRCAGARAGRTALIVLLLAAGALFARTADMALCSYIPFDIGTHFLWHVLLSISAALAIWLTRTIDQNVRHSV